VAELSPEAEEIIAAMSEAEVDLLLARTRPPEEPADPKARAVAALRRSRGLDRTSKASREVAADALRRYAQDNTPRKAR